MDSGVTFSGKTRKPDCPVDVSLLTAKQPITESPTMRSLVSNGIISPVVLKANRCSRRVKLWNRQASIIRDLTTLALRHEERCLPRV